MKHLDKIFGLEKENHLNKLKMYGFIRKENTLSNINGLLILMIAILFCSLFTQFKMESLKVFFLISDTPLSYLQDPFFYQYIVVWMATAFALITFFLTKRSQSKVKEIREDMKDTENVKIDFFNNNYSVIVHEINESKNNLSQGNLETINHLLEKKLLAKKINENVEVCRTNGLLQALES